MAAKLDGPALALIEALVCEGLTTAQIHEKVTVGSPANAPIEVSLRTIQARVSAVKLKLAPEPNPLDDATEIETLDAINRGWLRTVHREERRLNAKSKAGKLTDADRESMRRDTRVAAELRRYFMRDDAAPHSSGRSSAGAGPAAREPANILERIATAEAERGDILPPDTAA